MKFRRVPTRVRARVLEAPWEWRTNRGEPMIAKVGDYRVTDQTTDSEWSVTAEAFAASYSSLGGDKFESRGTVFARRVQPEEGSIRIQSLEGPEIAEPGDWVVEDPDANAWVVADWLFRQRYEAIDCT